MGSKKARLTVDLEPEVHARLKAVPAHKRTTMREYTAQAIQRQLSEEPSECLTAREAQVLAELWDNPDNAVYDDRP